MLIVKLVFVFLIIDSIWLTNALNCPYSTGTSDLIFAHVIHRHGNRSIIFSFKNDPYATSIFWPDGFGELTNVGKKTASELGKYLSRRYKGLIGDSYSSNKVYIRSSDVDRTLMSAQCVAAGIFPPNDHQKWDESLNWQPIPIHTVSWKQDYLLTQTIPCEKIDRLQEEYLSQELAVLLKRYRDFGKFLEKHGGTEVNTVFDYFKYYDTLYIENLRGLPLADWAKTALENWHGALEYLAALHQESYTHTTIMKKVRAGFLLKDMLDRFRDKISNRLEPNRSLWIYSAHDLTIVSVLNALGVFQFDMGPFATSLHVELYKENKNYYVQLFYRTDDSECMVPVELPCGTKCQLNQLYAIFRDILPKEHETFEFLCRDKPQKLNPNCKRQIK